MIKVLIEPVFGTGINIHDVVATKKTIRIIGVKVYVKVILHPQLSKSEVIYYPAI
ncbi:hypothetical protein M2451_003350 [Dysgonomonas sp. PFB1-18]|uniref:hypothetical protein n=1 Tax=unclassified Dysgonomonas TaxID=2630389 RepID=UPI0024735E3A|nr:MULTISPECIES: hypothetical protein [unclassified Dysgonomonas]MDH6310560.1 hypothetical protein [Dysgonomonas sp. PF1-14]MDH6340410.1 hypothetical protein [Dysgonomonas sp. PF1-16]MDH6382010.1 hypothetical protein [Dysgonomonas sp. PFB1-18]MDH6399381.1 hypothetical protein [Dysgonomonas sp. PF1-23]